MFTIPPAVALANGHRESITVTAGITGYFRDELQNAFGIVAGKALHVRPANPHSPTPPGQAGLAWKRPRR